MDNKDLKGLFEAYNEVYLDEALPPPGTSRGPVTMYRVPRASFAGTPRDPKFDRPRNANTGNTYQGVQTVRPNIGRLRSSDRQVNQYPQGVPTGVGRGNAGASRPPAPTSGGSSRPPAPASSPKPTPVASPKPTPVASPKPTPVANQTLTPPATSPKPIPATSPKSTPMDQWAKANPRLAAAATERARIRGTQQTDNPLMKDMRSNLPMNSRSVQSSEVSTLGKGNQSLINNPNAIKSKPPMKKESLDFSKPSQIAQDVEYLYQFIYEAKKKVDQDKDGDNDFADVQIAKMIASGMSKEEAIRKVRNKSYNEETELDEGRTQDLKRKYTAKYGNLEYPTDTLRLNKTRRAYDKASRNNQQGYGLNPRTAIKGKQNLGQAMYKAGQSARVINAEFELWVNELLDEGFDLSEFTVDEVYEIYEETELERRKKEEERINERRARVAELTASGRVMTSSKRTSAKTRQRAAEKRAEALKKAAQKVINSTTGSSGRVSEKPMGSEPPAPKAPVPEANRRLRTGLKRDTLGTAADQALKDTKAGKKSPLEAAADELLKKIHKEDFELYDLILSHLLDEGYVDDYESAETMIENMSDEWLEEIVEEAKRGEQKFPYSKVDKKIKRLGNQWLNTAEMDLDTPEAKRLLQRRANMKVERDKRAIE